MSVVINEGTTFVVNKVHFCKALTSFVYVRERREMNSEEPSSARCGQKPGLSLLLLLTYI